MLSSTGSNVSYELRGGCYVTANEWKVHNLCLEFHFFIQGLLSLNENAPLDKFMSSDDYYQYFRLNPSIPACYSKLLSKGKPSTASELQGSNMTPKVRLEINITY